MLGLNDFALCPAALASWAIMTVAMAAECQAHVRSTTSFPLSRSFATARPGRTLQRRQPVSATPAQVAFAAARRFPPCQLTHPLDSAPMRQGDSRRPRHLLGQDIGFEVAAMLSSVSVVA